MNRCIKCDNPIEIERLLAFNGNVDTCLAHAERTEMFGLMSYGHKTAGECVMMKNPTDEQKRQMIRAFRRAR